MRAVLQRCTRAAVRVESVVVGEIGLGLVVLLGVENGDQPEDVGVLVDKILGLRVFGDENDVMNHSVSDVDGSILVVSQFTLLAQTRRGRRPSFSRAARPEVARPLVERFIQQVESTGVPVSSGVFGATMEVELINDGPVTITLEVRHGRVL